MKTVISVASVLACVFSLDAQITTTLNRLTDGSTEIDIRNNSAVSLVAFVIRVNRVGRSTAANNGPQVAYYDPTIDPAMKPLLPNQARTLSRIAILCAPQGRLVDLLNEQNRREFFCELEQPITAGILADGSTTGDSALLARLLLRRSNMLLAVETALETLSDAGRYNIRRDQLIKQFRKMADSVNHSYLPPEQQVGRSLYQSIVGKLMSLPEGQVGSPFPPSTFVAQETAMLRQQRVTLWESQPSLVDAALAGR